MHVCMYSVHICMHARRYVCIHVNAIEALFSIPQQCLKKVHKCRSLTTYWLTDYVHLQVFPVASHFLRIAVQRTTGVAFKVA